jgi:hypothetical protein
MQSPSNPGWFNPDPKLDFVYEHLSREIAREENLINNRLTWMLTFQGFLFAAIALMGNEKIHLPLKSALQCIIPALGIAVAISGIMGVTAAYLAICQHRKDWENKLNNFPKPGGKGLASWLGRFASGSIPIVIILAWVYLLCVLNNST